MSRSVKIEGDIEPFAAPVVPIVDLTEDTPVVEPVTIQPTVDETCDECDKSTVDPSTIAIAVIGSFACGVLIGAATVAVFSKTDIE